MPKRGKIYQMTTMYSKLPWNILNNYEIYQITLKYSQRP
jgi:hypothetical protein